MSLNFVIPMLNINQGENTQNQLQFYRKGFYLSGGYSPSYQDVTIAGQMSLTLLNAKANGLNYLKAFGKAINAPEEYIDSVTAEGKCEQRRLPEGYTELEYIETSGYCYFSTEIEFNENMELEITCSNITENSSNLIGAKCPTTGGYFRIVKTSASQRITGSYGAENISSESVDGYALFTARVNKTGFYVNNSQVGTFTAQSPTGLGTIDIFKVQYGSNIYYATQGTRLKNAVIRINGVDVLNGIPCRRKSDDALGLFDIVSGTFMAKEGTGTFTAGAEVVPTPSNPIPIWCNNGEIKLKNLFNESTMVVEDCYIRAGSPTEEYPLGSEVRLSGVSDYNCSTFIPVLPSTQYTTIIPSFASISAGLCYYTGTTVDTVISGVPLYTQGSETYTFTTPSNCNYIRFSWKNDKGNACKLYSNEIYTDGTTETITDAVGNVATCQNLLSVDTYKDTQEILSGSVTRNIGIKVFNGSENWTTSSTPNVFLVTFADKSGKKQAYCTHFDYSEDASYAIADNEFGTNNQNVYYFKYSPANENLDNWKTFLQQQLTNGTPVIVVYPLATATTETVTGQLLTKAPVTYSGSITGLTGTTVTSSHTTPTPTQPLNIKCNNGVLKYRNLFDKSTMVVTGRYVSANNGSLVSTANWNCSTFIEVLPNKEYTLTLPGTWASAANPGMAYYSSNDVDTFISGVNLTTMGSYTYTFTTPATCNYLRFCWRAGDGNACGLFNHEIYTDGTVETVEVHGKNLWTINPPTHTGVNSSGGWNSNDTSTGGRYKVPCKPSTEYTVSWSNNGDDDVANIYWGFWDANDDWIKRVKSTGATVTTPENAAYLTAYYYIATGTTINANTTMQIEEGETATTYEPYFSGGSATAEMLLGISTYKDVQSVLDGAITRNVGVKVFDGSETFSLASDVAFRYTLDNLPANTQVMSNYFNSNVDPAILIADMPDLSVKGHSTAKTLLYFKYREKTTVEAFQKWLADQYKAGAPVIVVYPLEEPTTQTVTGQAMTIQKGTNIIEVTQSSIDNLELEAQYKAGVGVTITEIENVNLDNSVTVTIS